MADTFDSVNPLIWLHFRLAGGWRRIGWTLVLAAGLFFVIASVGRRMMHDVPITRYTSSLLIIVGLVQAFMILIVGGNAVHRAVRRDRTTRMMESHRLSPITEVQALIGYLIGPNLQALALFALGTVIGVGLSYVANVTVGYWLMAMAFLLIAAAMVWSMAMLHGLTANRNGNPIMGLLMASVFGHQLIIPLLPGVALVLGVNVIYFAYQQAVGAGTTQLPAHLLVAFMAEAVMTALWLFGAARKYRHPERPAYESVWGFVLLAVVLALFCIAYVMRVVLTMTTPGAPVDTELADVSSILATMMVAGVPVYAAEFVRRRGRLDGRPPAWWQRSVVTAGLATVLLAVFWMIAMAADIEPDTGRMQWFNPIAALGARQWLLTAWVVAVWLLSTVSVFRVIIALNFRSVVMPYMLWGILFSAVGLVIEQVRRTIEAIPTEGPIGWSMVLGFSPAGALYALWHGLQVPIVPGLSALTVLVVVMLWVSDRFTRRSARTPAPRLLKSAV